MITPENEDKNNFKKHLKFLALRLLTRVLTLETKR